jgi:F-type H+-transporting ATPase subunit gamma
MHRTDFATLFDHTLEEHVHLAFLRALGESLAAEHASRMASMQSAESNIEDRVGSLRQKYHRRRQSAITEEILDVMAGYEATGGG